MPSGIVYTPNREIIQTTFVEDQAHTFIYRLKGMDGEDVQQADIATAVYSVYDRNSATPTTAVETSALTVANIIFDSVQYDNRWPGHGYNFRHTITQTAFAPASFFRVEYDFIDASSNEYNLIYEGPALQVLNS